MVLAVDSETSSLNEGSECVSKSNLTCSYLVRRPMCDQRSMQALGLNDRLNPPPRPDDVQSHCLRRRYPRPDRYGVVGSFSLLGFASASRARVACHCLALAGVANAVVYDKGASFSARDRQRRIGCSNNLAYDTFDRHVYRLGNQWIRAIASCPLVAE